MTIDLAKLKARVSDMDAMKQELNKGTPSNFSNDERFWYPKGDDTGSGGAEIRFLPSPSEKNPFWARVWSYRFQGPTGAWYSEKALSTLGQKDPVGEHNSALWNVGTEESQNQARKQKRKLTIYSNIYVVKDPLAKENEGKVFLYRYGAKVWNMIDRSINPPSLEDEDIQKDIKSGFISEEEVIAQMRDPFNPFDPFGGANLRLKFKTVGDFRRYDGENMSKFLDNKPLFTGKGADEKLTDVLSQCYNLDEFVDESNFKSYPELKARLAEVLGLNVDVPEVEPEVTRASVETPALETVEVDDDISLDFLNEIDDDEAA